MKDTGALVVMILYFVLTIGIAIVVGRKKTENNADYTVGGRKFGGIVLFFTMLATIVGASSVMGYTEWFYKRGVTQIWYILGICVTYLIYVFYLGPKINDFGREKGGMLRGAVC